MYEELEGYELPKLTPPAKARFAVARLAAIQRVERFLDLFWAHPEELGGTAPCASCLIQVFEAYAHEVFDAGGREYVDVSDSVAECRSLLGNHLIEEIRRDLLPEPSRESAVIIGFGETLRDFEARLGPEAEFYRPGTPGDLSGIWEILTERTWVNAIRLFQDSVFAGLFDNQPFIYALRDLRNRWIFDERIAVGLERRINGVMQKWHEIAANRSDLAPTQPQPPVPTTFGTESPGGTTPLSPDSTSAERKAAVQTYKDECRTIGVTVTDALIAKTASPTWHNRTPVDRWKRRDRRSTLAEDAKIRRVLKDRPHLK